jgi:Mrp family chromosome partitioning ATPase
MRAHVNDRPEMTQDTMAQAEPPLVAKLDDQLSTLETQRIEALRLFTPDSRKVRDLDSLIETTKQRLVDARKEQWRQTNKTMIKDPVRKGFADAIATGVVTRSSLQRRVAAINAALAQVNADIKKLPQAEVDVMEKSRNLAILADKYTKLQQALGDLKFKGNAGIQQARKLFDAESQGKPVAPDLFRLLVVCTLGGAIVGFLFSLARESLRATAQTSNELSGLLGLPVSATVPLLQPRQAKAVFRSLPDPSFKPLESFKFMAFAMLYGKEKAPKRVLFTSVGGGVGCSTSAAQYAIAASKTGVKVVLMDADLRHETITKAFNANDKSGLREVINCLLLASDTADITVPTEHPTLRVVPAGSSGGDGITDVPVGNLSAFLDDLQTEADLIVIDSPPCDVVSDAMRFTPYVDEVVLVCSAKFTKYTSVLPAIDLLKRAGAESVRLVMTGTSPEEEAFSRRSLYVVR